MEDRERDETDICTEQILSSFFSTFDLERERGKGMAGKVGFFPENFDLSSQRVVGEAMLEEG